jgi:hypothetical protein
MPQNIPRHLPPLVYLFGFQKRNEIRKVAGISANSVFRRFPDDPQLSQKFVHHARQFHRHPSLPPFTSTLNLQRMRSESLNRFSPHQSSERISRTDKNHVMDFNL